VVLRVGIIFRGFQGISEQQQPSKRRKNVSQNFLTRRRTLLSVAIKKFSHQKTTICPFATFSFLRKRDKEEEDTRSRHQSYHQNHHR